MSLLTEEQAHDFRSLLDACSRFQTEPVVIGAVAYKAFIEDKERFTDDIDLAVALDLEDFQSLTRSLIDRRWKRDPRQVQRWFAPRGSRVDLVPAGPQARRDGVFAWPESHMVMTLTGFDHVFSRSVAVELATSLRGRVIPPPVLCLLKIAAILDDPYRRAKDIDDIHALLKWYEWGEDRMYSEEVLTAELDDISLGPAFLLGLDVAALPPSKTERGMIGRFLSIAIDESSTVCLRLLRLEGLVDDADDLLNARLAAFRRSLP